MSEEIEPEDGEDLEEVEPEDGSPEDLEDIPEEYRLSLNGRAVKVRLSQDKYVRLEKGGVKGLVEPRFVRAVQEAPQEGGRVYLKTAEPRQVLRSAYAVAGVIRFLGTSGFMAVATHENGRRVLEHKQYIRPIAPHAPALYSMAMALKELQASGTPLTAVALVYVKDRVRVLPVKSITAYLKRYRSIDGVRAYPEVRFLFSKPIIAGAKKRTAYVCDLMVLYVLPRKVTAEGQTSVVEESGEGSEGVRYGRYRTLPLGTIMAPPSIQIVTGQPSQEGQASQEGQEAEVTAGQYVQPVQEGEPLFRHVKQVQEALTNSVFSRSAWLPLEGHKYVKKESQFVKEAD